jgi:hypothetical protein
MDDFVPKSLFRNTTESFRFEKSSQYAVTYCWALIAPEIFRTSFETF